MAHRPLSPSCPRYVVPALASLQATVQPGAYVLEQRIQRRYRTLLREGLATLYPCLPLPGQVGPFEHDAYKQLAREAFPDHFTRRQKDPGRVYVQAEERIEHDVPELISRLPPAQLRQVAPLVDQHDLVGVVRLVWYTFRPLLNRLVPVTCTPRQKPAPKPRTCPPVEMSATPAVSSRLVLQDEPEPVVCTATSASPPQHTTREKTPVLTAHHWRVKQAQERKRLQRKRR